MSLLDALREEEARLEAELVKVRRALTDFGGSSAGTGARKKTGGARTMSKEARAKIAAAQKARWAKLKKGQK
jgi:hypothetical protein